MIKLIQQKKYSILCFFIGFGLMLWLLYPQSDMLAGSGDARSIWESITTLFSGNITPSYVLYKGFLSVYPYAWFYNIADFFGLNHFIFIKLYHCLLFAYVAGVGLPFTISRLLKIQVKGYRQVIFTVVLFFMIKFTGALHVMMVDLPSMAFFVLAVNMALKITNYEIKHKKIHYLCTGLCIGLCLCLSGQYSLSALILILYICVKTIPISVLKDKLKRVSALLLVLIMFVGIMPPKAYNLYFEQTVIQPMRDAGEWLPTGGDWVVSGLTRFIPKYKSSPIIPNYSGPPTLNVLNNRVFAIIKDNEADNFETKYELMQAGGGSYSAKELIGLYANYPLDFITSWGNRLFIGISFDGGERHVSHLFISYTSLFACLYLIFKKRKTVRDVFCCDALIPLAYLSTIAPSILLQIEMRNILSLYSLILAVGILSNVAWDGIKQFFSFMFYLFKNKTFKQISDKPFPYTFIIYIIFILMCFMLYATLLETTGSDPSQILFRW